MTVKKIMYTDSSLKWLRKKIIVFVSSKVMGEMHLLKKRRKVLKMFNWKNENT